MLARFRQTGAIVTALGALVPLLAIRLAVASGGRGALGGGSGGIEYEIRYGEMAMSDTVASTLLALAFGAAAAGLWAARDRRIQVVAVAAVVAAAIATALLTASAAADGTSSNAAFRDMPIGIDRAELERRLGPPDGTGTGRTTKPPYAELECLLYQGSGHHVYCFREERLVRKVR